MLHQWLALLSLFGPGDPGPCPTPFETWFAASRRGDLEIPPAVARRASGFRYVFVGGFRNERMPGYFAQNIAELKANGVPGPAIHVILPPSDRTTEQNASEVRDRFRSIAAEGPEKLVVIGHSRGACDALAFAIGDAGFVRDRVEALFLIQGPFGGSGVAEYAVGLGPEVDRRLAWRHRVLCRIAGKLVRSRAGEQGLEVIEGMTRDASRAYWEKALAEHPGAAEVIGPRTFYVRSEVEPRRLRFVRRAIAWYLRTYHGPSDGVVGLVDQRLAGLGTVVATLDAGHSDLTQKFPATRAHRATRKALARSILMAVGQPEGVEVGSGPGLDRLDRPEHPVPKRQTRPQRKVRRESGVTPSGGVVAAGGG